MPIAFLTCCQFLQDGTLLRMSFLIFSNLQRSEIKMGNKVDEVEIATSKTLWDD